MVVKKTDEVYERSSSAKYLIRESLYKNMKYRIVIEQDEDGNFVAECPALPGCISEGKTRKEALNNIKDAIEGYIESLHKHNEPVPPPIEEEVVEVHA